MDSGAHGNGTDDDRLHILDAITAAAGSPVYFPAGTYLLSTALTVANTVSFVGGTNLGPDNLTAHLKGRLNFGTGSSFTDLKIGESGNAALVNNGNVYNTSFTRCQFRGGGGGTWPGEGSMEHVITLNTACHDLTFTDCNVECNMGTEDAGHTKHYDNIYIQPAVVSPSIENVLFIGCHFGVSNGTRTGCPRYGIELYEVGTAGTRTHGHRNVSFESCLFEACDEENLDYAGSTTSADTTVPNCGWSYVRDCTFLGNGKGPIVWGAGDIIFEGGTGHVEVSGCTFYRGAYQAVKMEDQEGYGVNAYHSFHDNFIYSDDAHLDNGITHQFGPYIYVQSNLNEVYGNTLLNAGPLYSRSIVIVGDNNSITGNTFTNQLQGYVVELTAASSGNTLTGNTLTTGGGWGSGPITNLGTGNTVSPNP